LMFKRFFENGPWRNENFCWWLRHCLQTVE
jgi:hypothetical protein